MDNAGSSFTEVEHRLCPKCQRPLAIFRGHNAEGKPIWMPTHRIAARAFRPGTYRLA